MKIILGSSSKWRQQVMKELGFFYITMSPDIDEKAIRDHDPIRLVLKISEAKNKAIQDKVNEPAIIITADQVITCNHEIREKPVDEEQCRYFLKSYAEFPPSTVSGIYVYNTVTKKSASGVDIATAYLSELPNDVIDQLVAKEDIMNSAGGVVLEDLLLAKYLTEIDGTLDSIKGLPKKLLIKLIQQVK